MRRRKIPEAVRHRSLATLAERLLGLSPFQVAENIQMMTRINDARNVLSDGTLFNPVEEAKKFTGLRYPTVDDVFMGARYFVDWLWFLQNSTHFRTLGHWQLKGLPAMLQCAEPFEASLSKRQHCTPGRQRKE